MLETVTVFILFKEKFLNVKLKDKTMNIIKKVSRYSLGVYLIHPLIISVAEKTFELNNIYIHPCIVIFIFMPLVLIISYFISYVINKITKSNRYII